MPLCQLDCHYRQSRCDQDIDIILLPQAFQHQAVQNCERRYDNHYCQLGHLLYVHNDSTMQPSQLFLEGFRNRLPKTRYSGANCVSGVGILRYHPGCFGFGSAIPNGGITTHAVENEDQGYQHSHVRSSVRVTPSYYIDRAILTKILGAWLWDCPCSVVLASRRFHHAQSQRILEEHAL